MRIGILGYGTVGSGLIDIIDKNKDKILNIEYKIDEEIALELDGKEIDIKDAIKNIDIKELEI